MKQILYILVAVVLCGCEVIREQDRWIEVPIPQTFSERTHVLVEYTGFKCVNCPKAAAAAQDLSSMYGEKLIVVAMHPASNPFTQGVSKYDYTCPEADIYYQYMGGTAQTGFPTGNMDFVKSEKGYFSDFQEWPGIVASSMLDTTDLHIEITEAKGDTVSHEVNVSISAYTGEDTECRIAVWVVEDSIKGAQRMPDGTNNMEYYHRHVLRQTTGDDPWGEPVQLNGHQQTLRQHSTLPAEYDMKHCHVVAVAIDPNDKHILNAAEASINIIQQ